MESKKGYQLIEPDYVYKFHVLDSGVDIETIIISWLVNQLNKDIELQGFNIEIDFVVAEYSGRYPCIGIHYRDENIQDLESVILGKVETIRLNMSFVDFSEFALKNSELINTNLRKVKGVH